MTDEHDCVAAAEEFRAAAQSFVNRAAGYTAARWADAAEPTYRLVQWLADAAADTTTQPRRVVPRLDSEFALADQFVVVAHDFDMALRETVSTDDASINHAALYRTATAATRQLLAG